MVASQTRTRLWFGCSTIWLLLGLLGMCTPALTETASARRRCLFFDMGTESSPVEREYLRVTAKTVFTPEQGYGWEQAAEGDFDRPDAAATDALKRDGVFAREDLTFKVSLKRGRYYVRVWIGDPLEAREKMSVIAQDKELAVDASTRPTWWKGQPTTLLFATGLRVQGEGLQFRFFHEGTGNSVQAIELIPETGLEFDPGAQPEESPEGVDLKALAPALEAYRKGDFKASLAELGQVSQAGTAFNRAWIQTWIAGRLDNPGDELGLLKESVSGLQVVLSQNPADCAARKRLYLSQDYLTAVTGMRLSGYSHLAAQTGTGWGERRQTAQNLLAQIPAGDPLYYRALLNLARLSYWVAQKADDLAESKRASARFEEVRKAYPNNRLARMYLGEKTAWGAEYVKTVPGAPEWAQRQREALARINDVIAYWIDERQSPSGEFGGGWGDDVEMMRWWAAAAFATGSDKTTASMKRLADGIWTESGTIVDGFFGGLADVQHAAELTSDTQPPMTALSFADPVYVERCLASARLMDTLWTGVSPAGLRLFKSLDLGSRSVGEDPQRALEVPYHARAVLPAQWAAWYNGDAQLLRLLQERAEAWLKACGRTDKGKPEGVPPSGIMFDTGELGGAGTPWFYPRLGHAYYAFPGGVDLLFEELLNTFVLTRNRAYLAPIEACLAILQNPLAGDNVTAVVGGRGWTAAVLKSTPSLNSVWDKWRVLTGQKDYDEFLKEHGSPYIRWYLTGEKQHLVEGCKAVTDAISSNFELLTTEARYTDRIRIPNTAHLLAMATGCPGVPGTAPCWKATWHTNSKNFAALVLDEEKGSLPGEQTSLRALVYNFEPGAVAVRMRLWSLAPGEYEFQLGPDTDGNDSMDRVQARSGLAVYGRSAPVDFELPPGGPFEVAVRQKKAFEGIGKARPDLAFSPDGVRVFPSRPSEGERVFVAARLCNIGSAPASPVRVSLRGGRSSDAEEVNHLEIAGLAAPTNFRPSNRWICLDTLTYAEENHFQLYAEITDSEPGTELTLENNRVGRDVEPTMKSNNLFQKIFGSGKLVDRSAAAWVELATHFEAGAKALLPPDRARSIKQELEAATEGANPEELRMIRSLLSYVDAALSGEVLSRFGAAGQQPEEQSALLLDLGTESSPVEPEHRRVTAKTIFSKELGYGWEKAAEGSFDRAEASLAGALMRDGVFSKDDLTFKASVKPGLYYIRIHVGDPAETREKLSVYVQDQPLATGLTTRATWWRGEPTSLLVSGVVRTAEEVLTLSFFHEGTANSVQAIQIIPDPGPGFDPGLSPNRLPPDLDLNIYGAALEAYRKRNFTKAMQELDKIFEPGTDFTKAWILTWVAGQVDYPGDELEPVRKAISLLQTAVLREPSDFAARQRLLRNQDYLTATTYLRCGGYSDLVEKTGTGWGERRKVAQSLLLQMPPADPLHCRALLEIGRIAYWIGQKSGSSSELARASVCFQRVHNRFPGNPIARMYLGEGLPWGGVYKNAADHAPQWALRQREALARINDIINYWIDRRQSDTGEFGGGWGDDVEMMRWWATAALATGSDKVTASIAKLANGIWTRSGIIADGFFRGVGEVQYAAEPTADTQPLMLALRFGDPIYVERCLATGRLMDELWTEFNPKGHRLFRSVDLGSRRMGTDPKRAIDVPYHARAVIPAHWAAWYLGTPRLTYLFREWSDSWVMASRRNDKDKPAGVPPAGIAYATEELGGYGATWFNPKLGPTYYNFPGGIDLLFEHLLATYLLTQDAKYLQPIESCLELLQHMLNGREERGAVGGGLWVARVLQKSQGLSPIWDKWRLLTGKKDYDHLLSRHGSSYAKWLLTGKKKHLVEGCQEVIGSIDRNFELLTSEVRYTDRVRVANAPHLIAMATGGPGLPGGFPCWKVTWHTNSKNFAALVLHEKETPLPGRQTSMRALVYNFEEDPLDIRMRLWALMPGEYELSFGPDADDDDRMDYVAEQTRFEVYGKGTPVEFRLPPTALHELRVRQLHPRRGVPPLRPDVAVSPADIQVFPSRPVRGERVFVATRVHNIGGEAARGIQVTLARGEGPGATELARRQVSLLDAPKDLKPRAAWIWADVPMHSDKIHFQVRAEIAGAERADELTIENNQAGLDVSAGTEPNTDFEQTFSHGKLNEKLVPIWVELAQIFEGKKSLTTVSVEDLRAGIESAAAGAGEAELRMIGNLRAYAQKLPVRPETPEGEETGED